MQASKIPKPLFTELDIASRGKLQEIQRHCEVQGWELDISCLTRLEGLPGREMKLTVTATHDGCTELFSQAPLEGSARILGWNLYLTEKASAVREGVRRAIRRIEAAS